MKDAYEILNALSEARDKDHLLKLDGSCEYIECPARDFTVTVRDDEETLLALIARNRLRCPLCGSLASLQAVRTRRETTKSQTRPESSGYAELGHP